MAVESQKDIENLKKRLQELASKAYERNCYVYTGFLGLAEQSVLFSMERDLSFAGMEVFGGTELAERKIARFGKEENCGYSEPYPITALQIKPPMKKFAEDLSHRDFLGAIMNLGIERTTVGDIFVKDKEAVVFCQESIAEFLQDNLDKIRHTNVVCKPADEDILKELTEAKPTEMVLQVASERIDVCLAKLYNISRSESFELFRQGKIFVDGKLCENNSYLLKQDNAVTVRGYGKFIFRGVTGETRKKKLCVQVAVFGR